MILESGENLIFILSLPRSGSTLLSAILGNHSEVFCPPEPWLLLRLHEIYGEASEGKIFDDYLASKAVKGFLNSEQFLNAARSFAVSAYNASLAQTQAVCLVDKTPRYYHILDFLQALFPKSKKIWLKRNPLDVAASYKTSWNRGVDYLLGETLDPTSFDLLLGLPKLAKFFQEPATDKYELLYEDLIHNPEEEIKKLADFCQLPFETAMLNLAQESKGVSRILNSQFGDKKIKEKKAFDASSVGQWQTQLSTQDIKRLTGVIGRDIFIRMGYDQLVTEHEAYFAYNIEPILLEKARQRVESAFHVMKTVQMAMIYDYEQKNRTYEADLHYAWERLKQYETEQAKWATLSADNEKKTLDLAEELKQYTAELIQKKIQNEEQNHLIQQLQSQNHSLTDEKQTLKQSLNELQMQQNISTETIHQLNEQLKSKDLIIAKHEQQLLNLQQSRAYRVGQKLFHPFKRVPKA